jgi:hypothetical protein
MMTQEHYCMNLGCFGVVKGFQIEPFCSKCASFTLCPTPYEDAICATFTCDNVVKIVWHHHAHNAVTVCFVDEVETVEFRNVLMPSRPPDDLWKQVCMWVSSRKTMITACGCCSRCGGKATRSRGVRDYCASCQKITGSFRPEQEICRGCRNLARKGRDMCRACNSKQVAELQAQNASIVQID